MTQDVDKLEWAWAAGLFEGEGHIGMAPYKDRRVGLYTRQLVLAMTDEDVVLRFHRIVGCGSLLLARRQRQQHKQVYRWQVSNWPEIERILRTMLPYFGERRAAKAQLLFDNPAGRPGAPTRTHCKRGHEMTDDNCYFPPCGGRTCRACIVLRRRARAAARSATRA